MLKKNIAVLCLSSLLFLSGCSNLGSTLGSLAGAAIASKEGKNALLGSVVGGAIGQVVDNASGGVAGQIVK